MLIVIFFADSMLFSLEFRLASVNFFFPAYYLAGVGLVIAAGDGDRTCGEGTAVAA